jgi:hypothetical protein
VRPAVKFPRKIVASAWIRATKSHLGERLRKAVERESGRGTRRGDNWGGGRAEGRGDGTSEGRGEGSGVGERG